MNNKIVFLDIDTQYDFMNPCGKLYVPGAEELIPNLRRLFRLAKKNNIAIISSLDTHTRDDPEFKSFSPHCIRGSQGHKKIKGTLINLACRQAGKAKQIFIPKHTIDIFSNPKIKVILKPYRIAYVFGVALDYCVKAACLGLVNLGIKTYLVKDATKAVSSKGKTETLSLLKRKGIILIRTKEVVERLVKINR